MPFYVIIRDGSFLTPAGRWSREERLAWRFPSLAKAKAACERLADPVARVVPRVAWP